MDFEQARYNMIEQQIRPWDVLDQRVLDTFAALRRDRFAPEPFRALAYCDTQIPLAHDECMLSPNVEGRLLQALQLRPDDEVLEVGTGSGFLVAMMAALAKHVQTVEIHADLSESAQATLREQRITNVTAETGDAADGWGEAKSYNAIAITGALPDVPDAYRQALRVGGRLFSVCGTTDEPIMEACLITRVGDGNWVTESLFETRFTPLRNATRAPEFVF